MAPREVKPAKKPKAWKKRASRARPDHDPGEERVCLTCRRNMDALGFPDRSGKRGRPRLYCTLACCEVAAAIVILGKHLTPVAEIATPEGWATIRKDIWHLGNLRAWNKGASNTRFQEKRGLVQK